MKIVTIEPTPSPNSMKIVVDEELPFGKAFNFTKEKTEGASEQIKAILEIEGVKGVYHVADFLAVERNAKFQWEPILASVRVALGEKGEAASQEDVQADDHFGEVFVHVQMFRGLPLQVKVFDSAIEHRVSAGERFVQAFQSIEVDKFDDNYLLERKWVDFGVRYGEKEDIANEIIEELNATYPEERVAQIVEGASKKNTVTLEREKVTLEQYLAAEDWQKRYQLLDQLPDPEVDDLPLFEKALEDDQMSIRRLATVYLGMIDDVAVVPYLARALKDKSSAVRRTAGDCMSDLGLVEFEPYMIEALKDKNKLVRWRAAMYLFETGTESCLPALHDAEDDKEFEVKLQVKMAIARIEQGEEAKGSVWKQMTER
ncbi:conserved virulence factor C family protein [Ureibacillus chungkukjangi]|uniref:conserved virulence factor C family protein n=1 Tax=Ureibacillus chungkukjangi TaxID=1202712 RepID=UPI0020419A86|nr:conserved virulence factor C family protein [Ureibacillus chungkukjangi]MCM3387156.1 conserved virulence factor C family protein [Ureibacillus chungkukjangi]